MTERRAIIVTGPQSSGTRMVADAVESGGATYLRLEGALSGDRVNGVVLPEGDLPRDIVLHRSIPEGSWWPKFDAVFEPLKAAGYTVQPLVVDRDWHATIHSVLYRNLVMTAAKGEEQIRLAWKIASALPDAIFVSYEQFVQSPEMRRWLIVERLGLGEPTGEFHNANAKHYDPGWPPPGAKRGRLP